MSSFDRTWLALREPVDARSRNQALLESVVELAGNGILDIGCGTGSTFRTLGPRLTDTAAWRLLDNDPALLNEVRNRHGDTVETIEADLNEIDALPLRGVTLVTASALFDLCSERFIRDFAGRLAATDAGLYAALSYDGEMSWSKPHPLDTAVTAGFNAHQHGDKGFGPSLGPKAWETLAESLEQLGYVVEIADSPWLMTSADAELQRLFLDGIVLAVLDGAELDEAEIGDWAKFRRRMVEQDGSLCCVGHKDVLARRRRS